ncbi:MAG: hypothetical protein OIF57_17410 [Marinobacterium sp.]|nr:hypothetical protein [Marinobacterium sp.]
MDFESLNAKASQTGFAKLVGISQPAVNGRVQSGQLHKGGTYREWLLAYVDDLREKAAGRGGEEQASVAQATVEEKQVKTALNRLEYHKELGRLVDIEEAKEFLGGWAAFANRQFMQAFERMVLAIESEHGIEISPELREKYAGTATERIRGYVDKLSPGSGDGRGDVPAAEGATNEGVSGV